jgi:hypothetical protein
MFQFTINKLTYEGIEPLHGLEVSMRVDSTGTQLIHHPSLRLHNAKGQSETLCFPAKLASTLGSNKAIDVRFVYRNECVYVFINGAIETSARSCEWRIKRLFALNAAVGADLDHNIAFRPAALIADPC